VWFHSFISESSANLNNFFCSYQIHTTTHHPAPAHPATNGKNLMTAPSHINVGKLPRKLWHTRQPNGTRGSNLSSLYPTSPNLPSMQTEAHSDRKRLSLLTQRAQLKGRMTTPSRSYPQGRQTEHCTCMQITTSHISRHEPSAYNSWPIFN